MESEQKLQRKKIPPLVPDDLHILPIIVRSENNEKFPYVSFWNLQQLSYVTVLNDQCNCGKSPLISVPKLPRNSFQTIEKIALLFSVLESAEDLKECERLQSEQLEECFSVSKKSPKYLFQLLKTADFLNCPSVYNACLKYLSQQTKNLLHNNKIKLALRLMHPRNGPLTQYLASDILRDYKPLRNLFIRASNQSQWHHETGNNWYTWSFDQDNIIFQTKVPIKKIKCWFDRTLYEIHLKSTANLHRTYICPVSKRFFGLFADNSLEAYDLTTQTFLGSCKIPSFTCSIYYSHAMKKLFLVDNLQLIQYRVTEILEQEHTSLQFREEQACRINSTSYTGDTTNGNFYIALEKNCISHYDSNKNTFTLFPQSKKNKKRKFLSLCLSHNKKTLYALAQRKIKRKYKHELCFWNTEQKKLFKVVPLKSCYPYHLTISPDDSLLAFAGYRKDKIHLLDAQYGTTIRTFNKGNFPVIFSLDGTSVAIHNKNGFTEHTLQNVALEKQLKHYSPEHIALLAGCAKAIFAPRSSAPITQFIQEKEKTKVLIHELPASLQPHLKQLFDTYVHKNLDKQQAKDYTKKDF